MTGESFAAIDAALDRLPRTDWTVLRGVPLPGRASVALDHVVVGPSGVFVIQGDTTSGRIVLKNDGMRVHGRRRQGALDAAASAAVAIGERLATLDVRHVHGVVCFVREEEVKGRAGQTFVTSTESVEKLLLGMPAYFSAHRARSIAEDVEESVLEAARPRQDDAFSRRRTGVHREQPSEQLRARSTRRGARAGAAVLATAGLLVAMFALVVLASLYTLFTGIIDTNPAAAQDTATQCERVNANHPHGVGRPGAHDKVDKGEKRVKKFTVGKRLCRELHDLDTDHDGIACEQR